MSKKLKIKFWRAEKALAMQILEQEGLPKVKNDGFVNIVTIPVMYKDVIYLRGDCHGGDFNISGVVFETNADRDEYLDKLVNAITSEPFTGTGELKVGEMCEVSSCPNGSWKKRKLITILPNNYRDRFIAQADDDENDWFCYKHARPLAKRTEPKVETNGEIITYTWEEE